MGLRRYKKYIKPLSRLRRSARMAVFYLWHADGWAERRRLLRYYKVTVLRSLGLNPPTESEWTVRFKDVRIHFNPMFAELATYRSIFVNHIYERRPDFLPQDREIIFDVGANIGLFTIRVGRRMKGGMIYAFEPNPDVYSKLVKNIEANHLKNVRSFPYAVGAERGKAGMVLPEGKTTGGRLTNGVGTPGTGVEVVTLDEMVKMQKVPRIDLLKIDVEGHEIEVLKGAQKTLGLTRRIIMEHHGEELLAEARKLLAGFGFKELLIYRRNVYFVRA